MRVSKKIWVPVILAIVMVVAVSGAVFAQTATPQGQTPNATPNATTPGLRGFMGRGFGWFGGRGTNNWAVFDAVAKALKFNSPTDLFNELHSGKTLAQIAQEKGVDMATVQQAAQAAGTQAMKDAIAQAVKDGKITQAQADWMLQGLNNGWLGRGHFGRGFGRFGEGMGMPRSNGQSNGQQNNSSSGSANGTGFYRGGRGQFRTAPATVPNA